MIKFESLFHNFSLVVKQRKKPRAKLKEECKEFLDTPTADEAADVFFEVIQYYNQLSPQDKAVFDNKFYNRCVKHRKF